MPFGHLFESLGNLRILIEFSSILIRVGFVEDAPFLAGNGSLRGIARRDEAAASLTKGLIINAFFRNIVGGELEEYTKMLAEAREQALNRMIEEARGLGADAVLDTRYGIADITNGAAEILIYGTAVRLEDDP